MVRPGIFSKSAILFTALASLAMGCAPMGSSPALESPAAGQDTTPAQPEDSGGTVTTPGETAWYKLAKPSGDSSPAEAGRLCTALARRALLFGIPRVIVAFEGLASFDRAGAQRFYDAFERDPTKSDPGPINAHGGYLLHGFMGPLLKKARGHIEFLSFPHESIDDASGSAPETCVRAWLAANPAAKLTIIGHSYGGHAANQLAQALDRAGVPIDSVFTLDARTKFGVGSLVRTVNAAIWENFYQTNTPFLNGYVVPGADFNMNLTRTGVGHVKVPAAPEVWSALSGHLLP